MQAQRSLDWRPRSGVPVAVAPPPEAPSPARVLVAFDGRSGLTQHAARGISAALGAASLALAPTGSGAATWLHSAFGGSGTAGAGIERPRFDPRRFDLVVIGTPIRCGRASRPVQAFLRQHGPILLRTAFFGLASGGHPGQAFERMALPVRHPPIATMVLAPWDLDEAAPASTESEIARFVAALRDHGLVGADVRRLATD